MHFPRSYIAAVLLFALTLSACDSAEWTPNPAKKVDGERAELRWELSTSPRDPSHALQPPGADDPAMAAKVGVRDEPSPFACRISTLQSEEAVTSGLDPYVHTSVYLHFPPGLVKQAEGEVQCNKFVIGHQDAPEYAEPIETVLPEGIDVEQRRGVRMARCYVLGGPKHEQIGRQAQRMVGDYLKAYPEDSWVGQHTYESPKTDGDAHPPISHSMR